jgi:H-NS histone C-terminal domain
MGWSQITELLRMRCACTFDRVAAGSVLIQVETARCKLLRGAQPRWLTAAIKSGAKRDDFLVDRSARKAPKKKTRKVKRRRSKR